MSKKETIFKIAGIVIPIVLFVSPASSIILANSKIEDGHGFAIPFSLLILPLLLYWLFVTNNVNKIKIGWFNLLLYIFFGWMTILAIYSSIKISIDSYLYLFQWICPYLFIYFYAKIQNITNIKIFLNAFFLGTIFSCSYVFLAGALEFLSLGIGNGRMHQNVILPGFYQLYVYVPTVLAFSSLICICALRTCLIQKNKLCHFLLYFLSFFAILFTGAREGLLIYMMGLLGIFMLKNKKTIFIKSVILLLVMFFFYSNRNYFIQQAAKSDFMLFAKYAKLTEEGQEFAGRDKTIEKFVKIIVQEPIIGTAMLPPNYLPSLGVDESSSAHNYYFDTFAWGGFIGFLIILILYFSLLTNSVINIFKNINNKNPVIRFFVLMNFLLIILILISNNINVPMRQPLTGAIGSFLIYTCVYFKIIKRNNATL